VNSAEERKLLLREVLVTLRYDLKPLGFRQNGRRFERERGDELIDFISVQCDRYPDPNGLCLRINAETLPLALWRLHVSDWPNPKAGPGYHFWETELGKYVRPPPDLWHTVHTLAEARLAASDGARILVEHALPFLERVYSAQDAIDAWKRGDYTPMTPFFRDRMIARWEGRPEPSREDYPPPSPEFIKNQIEAIKPLLTEVARKKADFFSRRRK
jgi:hypothetical protein